MRHTNLSASTASVGKDKKFSHRPKKSLTHELATKRGEKQRGKAYAAKYQTTSFGQEYCYVRLVEWKIDDLWED